MNSLLTYILIGWIYGTSGTGAELSIEFDTLATCEIAKAKFQFRHEMELSNDDRNFWDSWVECVEK